MVALVKLRQKQEVKGSVYYSDVNMFDFISYDNNDVKINIDIDAVKASLYNLLMTNPGERLFNSSIGSGLKHLLFENITLQTTIAVRETIKSCIENFEPRAKIVQLIVSPLPDDNAYAISIVFSTINSNEPIAFELLLNRIR